MLTQSRSRFPLLALLVLLFAGASSCSSTKSSLREEGTGWLAASPALQRRIDDEARRLPWTHGVERVELIHWFAALGEPAYGTLLTMVADPRKDVAIAALAALGATRDSRLVAALARVQVPEGADAKDLQLERARTLLRLGDWQAAPTLIAGLRDERLFTRALCSQALTEATHESFGFDPKAEEPAREECVRRWESWWKERSADALLPRPATQPRGSGD